MNEDGLAMKYVGILDAVCADDQKEYLCKI